MSETTREHREKQCRFGYRQSSVDRSYLCCARESGHEGPHVNCYEKYWAWHEADHKQPGCKFVTEWGGALPAVLYCGRPAGHEGLHCTHSQLDASWFERPAEQR